MGDNGTSRGMLTSTDKEFLRGNKEYTHRQSRYKRRAGVRERVCNTISDFALVWEELPSEERGKIYDELELPPTTLRRALVDMPPGPLEAMCAVAYEAALHHGIPPKFLFHNAVKRVETRRLLSEESHRQVKVDVDFDVVVEEPDNRAVAEAIGKLGNGLSIADLKQHELSALMEYATRSDSVNREMVMEAAREELEREQEEGVRRAKEAFENSKSGEED